MFHVKQLSERSGHETTLTDENGASFSPGARIGVLIAAALALAACGGEKREAASGAPAASADARALWAEYQGAWAPTGRCDDDRERWIIAPDGLHIYETHCAVETLARDGATLKARARCSVEGYDDPDPHSFVLTREGDGSLTIAEEGAPAPATGLFLCNSEETEL
jgi:hypothetical protein